MPARRVQVNLFYLMTALYWAGLYTYPSLLVPHALSLGATQQMAGLIAGSYGFMQLIVRLPLGIWSDRCARRKPFVVGCSLAGLLSAIVFLLFKSPAALLIARSLSGIAASGWVLYSVMFTGFFTPDRTVHALGVLTSANNLGIVTATWVGGLVAQAAGIGGAFVLSAALSVGAVGLSLYVREERGQAPAHQRVSWKDLLHAARDKNLLVMSMLAVLFQFMIFGTANSFTSQLAQRLGAGSAQIGTLGMIATLPGILISPFTGRLNARLGAKACLSISFLWVSLGTVLMPYLPSMGWLYAVQLATGLGRGLAFPLLLGLSTNSLPLNLRASGMGFYQAVYSLGMFLGPVAVGMIGGSANLEVAYMIVSGVGLAAASLALLLAPRREKQA